MGRDGTWISAVIAATAAAVLVFWPRLGLLARGRAWREWRERARMEDALKHLLGREHQGRHASPESLAGALKLSPQKVLGVITRMEARGLLQSVAQGLHLTAEGERWALQVVRAHRLWERYLADEAGLPVERIHRAAERAEHRLTATQVDALDAHLGHPQADPHGDPIPAADGTVNPHVGVPLTDWPHDKVCEIVHVEDEPEVLFRQIVALGLRPGMQLRVIEADRTRLVISDGIEEHRLAPALAASIHVQVVAEPASRPEGVVSLDELRDGEEAEVVALDPLCRGFNRRRLLDLGLTPGAAIYPALRNVFGDPRAFRVRGTLIALRREQTPHIWVRRRSPPAPESATPQSEGGAS
ncbi:MAG: FeoA domain-containing protein [Deltaproteobacteria bacterium]|nr:FeoA domain-containing protein [Deltaproteobacteria bacterium]